VNPKESIARFMNKEELDKYGWQFDHFHFELLKRKPIKINPSDKSPERFYNSYSLVCYNKIDLHNFYYDPIEYFSFNLNR
jgi:hypothetical protein